MNINLFYTKEKKKQCVIFYFNQEVTSHFEVVLNVGDKLFMTKLRISQEKSVFKSLVFLILKNREI